MTDTFDDLSKLETALAQRDALVKALQAALTIAKQNAVAATPAWEPTPAQINSACLSYRHDFGLLPVSEAAIVKSEAKEWLRAWQKEGMGADRNEIIEQCACVVDRANREGPYQAIAAASRIRELKASTVTRPHQQEESK